MDLLNSYEEYVQLNKEYVAFIEELIHKNFEGFKEDDIKEKLTIAKSNFERLRNQIDGLNIDINDENLKDLKYLVIDALFLAIDLYNFYNSQEIERFKMRGVNYIRKRRVADFFK